MDATLVKTLSLHGLDGFVDKLSQLGVENGADILFLKDSDMTGLGMSTVQVRKIQAALGNQANKELSPTSDGDAHFELLRVVSTARRKDSRFWIEQSSRPRRLIFVRHGESEANVNRTITATVPDHMLHLTEKGRAQALEAGHMLKEVVGDETVKFVYSPYVRTRETLNGILQAWEGQNMHCRMDVRIREQEYGNYDSPDIKVHHKIKKEFGPFYYRFPDGESPADCFDRASSFLESQYRSWQDNKHQNQVIVCHGMMILVILMRMLRLPIDEFDHLESLKNCELVVMERPDDDAKYHVTYTWAPGEDKRPGGIRRKAEGAAPTEIWDGKPDSPMLTSDISAGAS